MKLRWVCSSERQIAVNAISGGAAKDGAAFVAKRMAKMRPIEMLKAKQLDRLTDAVVSA